MGSFNFVFAFQLLHTTIRYSRYLQIVSIEKKKKRLVLKETVANYVPFLAMSCLTLTVTLVIDVNKETDANIVSGTDINGNNDPCH